MLQIFIKNKFNYFFDSAIRLNRTVRILKTLI